MAVKIRLARHGRKKRPFYRIVVTDSRRARDGRFIDTLGTYSPIENPARVSVNVTKTFRWLGEGAQMSGTVERIFDRSGVLSRYATGEALGDEETKISVEIFGHALDEHGSKRKGKRKQAPSVIEEAAETPAETVPEIAPEAPESVTEETPAETAPEPVPEAPAEGASGEAPAGGEDGGEPKA